jgi:hypothetical protein
MAKLGNPARETLQLAIFVFITIVLGNLAVKLLGEKMEYYFWGFLFAILFLFSFIRFRRAKRGYDNFVHLSDEDQNRILESLNEDQQWQLLYRHNLRSPDADAIDQTLNFTFSNDFIAQIKHNIEVTMVGIIFFTALATLAWYLGSRTVYGFAAFSFFGIAMLRMLLAIRAGLRQRIEISSFSVTEHNPKGESISIKWEDIGGIRYHRFHKRIVLKNLSGDKSIDIERQIYLFYRIARIIEMKTGVTTDALRESAFELQRQYRRT